MQEQEKRYDYYRKMCIRDRDSTQGDNEFMPFRNIINEWYAKDTSKKIRAVMKVKGNAGEHLTVLPPYGYMKSSDDKKQWVKDCLLYTSRCV